MELNYLAIMFLAVAFAFVYASKRYRVKYNTVWLLLAVGSAGAYVTLMLTGGYELLDAAAGLAVLLLGVLLLGGAEERNNAV